MVAVQQARPQGMGRKQQGMVPHQQQQAGHMVKGVVMGHRGLGMEPRRKVTSRVMAQWRKQGMVQLGRMGVHPQDMAVRRGQGMAAQPRVVVAWVRLAVLLLLLQVAMVEQEAGRRLVEAMAGKLQGTLSR
jgi:hypothetical protein